MAPPEEDEDGFARKLEMHTLAKSYKKLIAKEERDRSTMPCKSDDFRRSNDTLTSPEDALSARTIGLPAFGRFPQSVVAPFWGANLALASNCGFKSGKSDETRGQQGISPCSPRRTWRPTRM